METGNDRENKVISLTARSQKSTTQEPVKDTQADFDWDNVMKKNNDNSSRQQQERDKANKGVIRSYRLKH